MNERIRDLYEQACDIERENELATKPYKDRVVIKFAELIVRECSDVADENYIHRGSRTCGLAIRLHFGVEE